MSEHTQGERENKVSGVVEVGCVSLCVSGLSTVKHEKEDCGTTSRGKCAHLYLCVLHCFHLSFCLFDSQWSCPTNVIYSTLQRE